MKNYLVLLLLSCIAASLKSQPNVQIEAFASGFDDPVDIAHAGDSRLFIVERPGTIRIIDSAGTVLPGDFLDISSLVESGYSEQGLLGLAFHPDYPSNGYFYVNYIDVDGNTVVARYSVDPSDPNAADAGSEYVIFTAEQPYANHNGGCLKFGPDGYLYIALGDGGSGGDPDGRAQNPLNALGKIHRLDVDGGAPYAIPEDNPFYGAADTLETIWDLGLRNPWRFSFDRLTGDMWIADVGQDLWEEVNFEAAATGGINYGWRCYEGNHEYSPGGCEDESFYAFPVYEYAHDYSTGGYSVTGGFIYRGDAFPGLYGYYLFADYISGNWWCSIADGAGGFVTALLGDIEGGISTFGEDANGELYCADMSSGIVYRITELCGGFDIAAVATDYFCDENMGTISLEITEGVAPFAFEWNTGATDSALTGLLPGIYTVTVIDSLGCTRTQSVTVNDSTISPATIAFDGSALSVGEGMSWQWYYEGNPIGGATDSSYIPGSASGNYTVAVTYANGCTVLSNIFTFIADALVVPQLSKVQVYPNPAEDIVRISAPEQIEIIALQLYSMDGNRMYQLQNTGGKHIVSLDISHLPAGVYALVLHTSAGTGNYPVQKVP